MKFQSAPPFADSVDVSTSPGLKTLLSEYRGSHFAASVFQLTATVSLFVTLWLAMWWSLDIGYWLTLLLAAHIRSGRAAIHSPA